MYQNFIIPYFISFPYIIIHTWKVVERVVVGRCQAQCIPDNAQQLYIQQPSTYAKPEAASAVLGS